MLPKVDIQAELARSSQREGSEEVVQEARRILSQDLFTEKKILSHLRHYSRSFALMDEEDADPSLVFTPSAIRKVAVRYRLKFLESRHYRREIPYSAILEIKRLNRLYRKDLAEFFILSVPQSFMGKGSDGQAMLFVKTNYDNYVLIQSWGVPTRFWRAVTSWPLRTFETLAFTVAAFTLILTLSLPTWLITLDHSATYWSGYRAAAFFHLLIFNAGVTTYFAFAFSRNFSSSVWNRLKDF